MPENDYGVKTLPQIACVDIGGTIIKYGVAESSGRLLEQEKLDNPVAESGSGRMLSLIISRINDLKARYNLKGIAVATAGMVNADSGDITFAAGNTFPGYTGTRVRDILTEKCGLPCTVENDVNCAVMGEWWLGAGKGASPLVCITVGTGIGGAVMIDGKLLRGINGCAGEIGLMHIGSSTLEALAATSTLVREAAEKSGLHKEDVDGEMVFAMAQAGNKLMQQLIQQQINYLADGIANICCLINPEVIVLGGGIMAQRQYLRPLIDEAVSRRVLMVQREKMRIEFARLGDTAGMIGAVYNFIQRNKR